MEALYKQLHAYVRRRLHEIYGSDVLDLEGALPASVLSDMFGRFGGNLYKDFVPYPEKTTVKSEMKAAACIFFRDF